MDDFWFIGLFVLGAYLVGAVPTGYLVVKALKGVDVRDFGSHNVGATNVKRVAGGKAALLVLVLDMLKGVLPVLIAKQLSPHLPEVHVLCAVASIFGHSRSVFLGFSGGKSAATGLGSVVALSPVTGIVVGLTAFLVIKLTRYVSIGSLTAGVVAPIAFYLFNAPLAYVIFGVAASLYISYLHRGNISRLMQGTENRLP